MTVNPSNTAADVDEIIDIIEAFFDQCQSNSVISNVSALDGYFAAIACAPNLILPSKWLPLVCGGDTRNPALEKMEDYETYLGSVMILYNAVMKSMAQSEYEALYYERVVDGKTLTIVDDWCSGFLCGVSLWQELSDEENEELDINTQAMKLFTSKAGWKKLDLMSDEEIEMQHRSIESGVRHLYHYFLSRRTPKQPETVRDTAAKAGRNDPCPCGSGKKYKKCCLH